ncbi:MAG: hypothetical protein LBI98_02810 [Endomicrobium sp.]|jgi:hypothetical protein|nr:hypothetical protein [Endomicrobium sp.]
MKNDTYSYQNCCCPHCETELKKGCLNPAFCEPCYINKRKSGIKVCSVCKSEYAYGYSKCPVCVMLEKNNSFSKEDNAS